MTFFGPVRSGKSELARAFFFGHAAPRICVDVKDEHRPHMPNVPTVESPREAMDYWTCRAVPPDPRDERWYDELFFAAIERGDTLVWLDEANEISRPNYLPTGVRKFILQGEWRECGLLACTPRPADISPSFAAQSSHVFSFRMRHPRDRLAVAQIVGLAQEEFDRRNDELDKYHFLHYDVVDGTVESEPPSHDPDELTARVARMSFGKIGE